jgi:hypothetical protein
MRNIWRKLSTTAALAIMLCLIGLVMTGTAFAQQCVDNGNGTVTDNTKGLMWQKATAGQMTWDAAKSYASGLSLGGHSGWRLPTIDELLNLYHSSCTRMMDVETDDYWSIIGHSRQAWAVHFHDGVVNRYDASNDFRVRAVRAGQ